MLTRKKFLQSSGMAALAALVHPALSAGIVKPAVPHPIGLQLFTLFNTIDNDVVGNLKRVAAIGYKEIESAFSHKSGFYGYTAKSFAQVCKTNGLTWVSHHVLGAPFKLPAGMKMPTGPDGKPMVMPQVLNLRDNMQQIVDQAAEGGIPYLVCANIPTGTLKEINEAVSTLNKTGEACKKAGITFAYHNHDMEFKAVEGKVPYHILLTETHPEFVKMELDLAWAVKGGNDPVELFKQNPGRFPLWHVKNLSKNMQTIMPAGEGFIDFKRIFASASTAGMKHFFVEHDMPADAFASITSSYKYLRSINV